MANVAGNFTKAVVNCIGVNVKGDSVIYMSLNGSTIQVSTNVVGFAKLAAAGIQVVNGRPA